MLTIDVEDWFHIVGLPSTPPLDAWSALPGTVDRNFRRMLDLLSEHEVRATCFFLGWIAERHPELVQEAVRRGHEIASHGYAHELVSAMTPEDFLDDARRTRMLLEDTSGAPVQGFRSPSFSVSDRDMWFFEALLAAGYRYDSSLFPASRSHGGARLARREPHLIHTPLGPIAEIPISVTPFLGIPVCFSGGGYLRLFPWRLIRWCARQTLDAGRPVVFYVHPREIDPGHPRLRMSLWRSFKSYVNLHTVEPKLRLLMTELPLVPCTDFLKGEGLLSDFPHISKSLLSN